MTSRFIITLSSTIIIIILTINLLPINKYKNSNSTAKDIEFIARKIASNCQKSAFANECYKKNFFELSKKSDLDFSKNVLLAVQHKDPSTFSCHSIAHFMGRAQVEKNPSKWKEILAKEWPAECSGGYFHGIIETHFGLNQGISLDGQEIESICKISSSLYTQNSCLHIFGHIIIVENYGDLEKSVKVCNQVKSSSALHCYSGIFMENMVRENLKEHGISQQRNWDQTFSQELESVCLKQIVLAKEACWGEMGFFYAELEDNQYISAYQDCLKAPEEKYREYCYLKAVMKISISTESHLLDNKLCNSFISDDNKFEKCFKYALDASMRSSKKYENRNRIFCLGLPKKTFQLDCLEILNRYVT